MNARPERATAAERTPVYRRLARLIEPVVARQAVRDAPGGTTAGAANNSTPAPGIPPGEESTPSPVLGTDPLADPDTEYAADAAGVENLLRCWLRETGQGEVSGPKSPEGGATAGRDLLIPLRATAIQLRAQLTYWSSTGHHRFGPVTVDGAAPGTAPVNAVTLAALLSREGAAPARTGGDEPPVPRPAGDLTGRRAAADAEAVELVGRVADSVRRTAVFLAERRPELAAQQPPDPFLASEQDLIFGHPLHPTPNSREGLAGSEARLSSPELRGSYQLHWIAVHHQLLAADSAWEEPDGSTATAGQLLRAAAGPGLAPPKNTVPLPLHPWQARDIVHRPQIARLLADGLLHDLGPHGEVWYPTSSIRTVHRPGAPHMLKLSLGLRITNSRRENLRKELHRGLEVHRLLAAGLGAEWQSAQLAGASFDVLRDRAWAGVDDPAGHPLTGLDLVIRDNPFGPSDDVACVAGLTAPRPVDGAMDGKLTSRLRQVVASLAGTTGRRLEAVSVEWFLRYLETVVRPVLWLDARAGVALEAHQQNTLVRLDGDGWPVGGWYRDNQGFYFREERRDELTARLPGLGDTSDTFVTGEVSEERLLYYLGINNILGLIGAFGSQGLASEELLLGALRRFLSEHTGDNEALPRSGFAVRLLESPTVRCKANLLTRLRGLDELVGPVDGQSVYVTVRNPVAAR